MHKQPATECVACVPVLEQQEIEERVKCGLLIVPLAVAWIAQCVGCMVQLPLLEPKGKALKALGHPTMHPLGRTPLAFFLPNCHSDCILLQASMTGIK